MKFLLSHVNDSQPFVTVNIPTHFLSSPAFDSSRWYLLDVVFWGLKVVHKVERVTTTRRMRGWGWGWGWGVDKRCNGGGGCGQTSRYYQSNRRLCPTTTYLWFWYMPFFLESFTLRYIYKGKPQHFQLHCVRPTHPPPPSLLIKRT